jgi:hypothetical protein
LYRLPTDQNIEIGRSSGVSKYCRESCPKNNWVQDGRHPNRGASRPWARESKAIETYYSLNTELFIGDFSNEIDSA